MTIDAVVQFPPGEGDAAGGDDVRHRLLVALSRVAIALRSDAWKEAAPRGLNPTQAQLLVTLARRRDEGWRLSALAEALGVSAPTVSDSVSTLERKGLVRKARALEDRRALAVRLTDAGLREASALAEWPDRLARTVECLDETEQGVFLRALVKMIRELQMEGLVSPARTCATCRYFRPAVHDAPDPPHHCDFIDAAFGDAELRVECVDHDAAPTGEFAAF